LEAALAQCTKDIDFKEAVKEIRKDLSDVQTDLAARLDTQSVKFAKQEDLDRVSNTVEDTRQSLEGVRSIQGAIQDDLRARLPNKDLRQMRSDLSDALERLTTVQSRQTDLEKSFDTVIEIDHEEFKEVPGDLKDLEHKVKDLERWTRVQGEDIQKFGAALEQRVFVTQSDITKASRTLRTRINDEIKKHGVVTTAELNEALANLNQAIQTQKGEHRVAPTSDLDPDFLDTDQLLKVTHSRYPGQDPEQEQNECLEPDSEEEAHEKATINQVADLDTASEASISIIEEEVTKPPQNRRKRRRPTHFETPQAKRRDHIPKIWVTRHHDLNTDASEKGRAWDRIQDVWRRQIEEMEERCEDWDSLELKKKCLRCVAVGSTAQTWTKGNPGEYACRGCANTGKLCIVEKAGELEVLPLPPLQDHKVKTLEDVFLCHNNMISRRNPGVWA